jgi:hypothetical protein
LRELVIVNVKGTFRRVALAKAAMSDMDGADSWVTRQGGEAVRRTAKHVDKATVVIDPSLPGDLQDALVRAGGKLVPYRGPAPAPSSPANGARGCSFFAGIFFVVAIAGVGAGNGALAYTMLMFAGAGLLMTMLGRPSAREIRAAHAPVTQHRRYVLPGTDIDADHWKLWKRAVDARNRIACADVVNAGRIDSVQVAEVLPQRMWDIAERLARLAELRARHQEILGDVPPEDPDVAPAVTRQRRAQELALADATRRVSELEKFADLVDAADLAARKESIVRELNELDDTHAELLAGIGDTDLDTDLTHRLADDATAVIEQARQAIDQANAAALTLALPSDKPGHEMGDEPRDELGDEPGDKSGDEPGHRLGDGPGGEEAGAS